jgi:hypothetical protein
VLLAATRPAAMAGGLVALLGGVWFVVGAPILAVAVGTGTSGPGVPVASAGSAFSAPVMRLLEGLGFFSGLGVLIVIFAAFALGRFAVAGVHAVLPPDETEPVYPEERNPGSVWPGPAGR